MFLVLQSPPAVLTVMLLLVTVEALLTTLQHWKRLPFFISLGLVQGIVPTVLVCKAIDFLLKSKSLMFGALLVTSCTVGMFSLSSSFQDWEFSRIRFSSGMSFFKPRSTLQIPWTPQRLSFSLTPFYTQIQIFSYV